MNLLKRITLGLIAVLAIIAVVGVIAVNSLDPNRHKDRIQQLVQEKTGRQLHINGEVQAHFLPWVGLSLTDVTMASSADFSESNFASVQTTELRMQLLPLLIGQFKIDTVELQGLSLELQRDADGKTNWDDLMSTTTVVETDVGDDVMQEVEAGAPVVVALSIGGLQIKDAKVSFADQQVDSYVVLSDLDLTTGSVVLTEPFAFDSQFNVSSIADGIVSDVIASGEIILDLANNIYQLSQLQLETNSQIAVLPLDNVPVNLTGDLTTDLNTSTIDFRLAKGTALGVPFSGNLHRAGLQDTSKWTGQLSSGEFNAAALVDQLGFDPGPQFDSELLSRASVALSFEQTGDQLDMDDVRVGLEDIKMFGNFQLTNLSRSAVLIGQLASNQFDPSPWVDGWVKEWTGDIGLPANRQVFESAQFNTSIRKSGQLLSFNQLSFTLDDVIVNGDIEIADIHAASTPVNFALSVNEIDLDHYLSVDGALSIDGAGVDEPETGLAQDGSAQDATEMPVAESDGAIPLDALRALDIEGQVDLLQLTFQGLNAHNVVLPLRAKGGRIELKEARADLYSGGVFSTMSLDVSSDQPLLTVASNLNGVKAASFLADYLQGDPPLAGTASINLDLLSRGNTVQEILERANGAIATRVIDGSINGIDVSDELQRARNLVRGLQVQPSEEDSATDFTELSVTGVITDGVVQSDDLKLNSPAVQVNGQGGVNLAKRTVDYLLQITIPDVPEPVIDTDTAIGSENTVSSGEALNLDNADSSNKEVVLEEQNRSLQDDKLNAFDGLKLSLPVRGNFTELSVGFKSQLQDVFTLNLSQEIKAREEAQEEALSNSKNSEVSTRIESEKAALESRLKQEREDAAAVISEKNKQAAEQAKEKQQELEQRLPEEGELEESELEESELEEIKLDKSDLQKIELQKGEVIKEGTGIDFWKDKNLQQELSDLLGAN